jgi:enterochelin esterase-like enzyme
VLQSSGVQDVDAINCRPVRFLVLLHTMLVQVQVTSELLVGPRKVWVQSAVAESAADCLIFLDAELYIERVKAPEIVRALQTTGGLASVTCIYVSNVDAAARHVDFTCNERYAQFLATELLRWIEETVHRHERYLLCGLSLSGLAAAFAAVRHPGVFAGILCQSPSAWWNEEWLAASLVPAGNPPCRFWISVGDQELQENVSHPPSGLFQKTSQLASVRRLAQLLKATGNEVRYAEFSGGHDPQCWAAELPEALRWLVHETAGNCRSLPADDRA